MKMLKVYNTGVFAKKMTGGIGNQKNLNSPDKNMKKRDLSFSVISSPTR